MASGLKGLLMSFRSATGSPKKEEDMNLPYEGPKKKKSFMDRFAKPEEGSQFDKMGQGAKKLMELRNKTKKK